MKRNRSISKSVLSFCLAVMLILQTVTFSAPAYAEGASGDPGTAIVSESEAPDVTEPSESGTVDDGTEPSESDAVDDGTEPSESDAVDDETDELAAPVDDPVALMAGPADKTEVLMGVNSSFPLVVTQEGTVLQTDDTIHGRKPFTIKSTGIKVPVKGDYKDPNSVDVSTVILHGDYVMLDRGDYFKEVILPTATMTLKERSGLKIGTAYFSEEGIKVVFDGEERFFNGQGSEVTFGFESTAKADLTGMEYGDKNPISIFGGSYYLENPDPVPAYKITKRSLSNTAENGWIAQAALVEGAIEWQVEISATDAFDPDIPLSLEGLKFYDALDPITVGTYIEDSLKVNGNKVTPDSGTTNALAYTFPPGYSGKAIVTFKTWIPKAKYYREYNSGDSGWQEIPNAAELRDASNTRLLSSNSWRVAIKPDWIVKTGTLEKRANPSDPRIVTWTIEVNKNYSKQGLKDFTITDVLPAGLTRISSSYQLWDSSTKNWSATKEPISPDADNVYSFGDINGPVRLVIVSEVTGDNTIFNNTAIAKWDLDINDVQNNDAGTVKDSATVTIGAHTLTKSGGITVDDFLTGAVTWTVNLTPQEVLPELAVYDLLVYGGSIDLDKVDAGGEVSREVLQQIKAKGTVPEYWHKYKEGSFTTSHGLKLDVIPLTQDGVRVADLLRVTGYTDKLASFTFRSLVNHPDKFARQGPENGKTRYNRAYLFEGDEYLRHYDAGVNSHGRMLNKEMLYASKPAGTNFAINNVGAYIRNDTNESYTLAAYDQVTNTVTFRLAVNMNGLKTDVMALDGGNRVASDIRLVDTLPEGWEFVPYSEGKAFELYRAESGNGGNYEYGARADAREIIEPNDPRHVVSFSANGNVGTFTFAKLETPYVILVKAKPTESARRAYFESGITKHELYNTADLHIKWGDIPTVRTEKRKVIVPVKSLGKTVTKPNPGVLEWTVNYTPPFEMKNGVYLQDTLGGGLALRNDETGNLSLRRPDMAVYRAKLTSSGELQRDGDALDLYDPNCEVKVETVTEGGATRLIFRLADPNQFYQIVYQTEVTELPANGKVGNEIKLMGDDTLTNIGAKSESAVDSTDVGGSATTQGKLDLKKVDPAGNPLSGVEFTLYEPDGVTVVASGTTDANGMLSLFPKAGLYVLKQTHIDTNTYLPTTTVYQVRVASTPWNPIWVDGVEVTSNNPLVVPTPVWVPGDLKLDTAIKGAGADPDKEFEYVVSFSNGKSYAYTGSKSGTVASGTTVTLKGGESITIKDIPDGITYIILQKDYTGDGYVTDPAVLTRAGSIVANETAEAKFVNAKHLPGKLTIGETVQGNGGDKNKAFEFTVTFDGAGASGEYAYTKSDGTTGIIKSGGKIALKHGQTVAIDGIPMDTDYTVAQTDYAAEGYTSNWPDWSTAGTIIDGGDHKAEFVNTRMVYGGLLIGQTVEGRGADKDKAFEFTVTFGGAGANEEYAYTKSDGTTGKIKSGDTIALKHGETAAIAETEILTDTTYTVTQTDYSSEGYTNNPVSRTHSGTIVEKQIAEARFVNAKYLPGQLLIGQTVTGNGGQPDKAFEFTVTFGGAGASEEYAYTQSDGTTGMIKSGGKITLKHEETVAINGIPKDTTYTVTETDYSADGYTTDPSSLKHTGTILEGNTHEALFVNKRTVYGSLTIVKKVAGNGGQRDKAFEFTVTFDGEGKNGSYAYIGTGVPSGSLKSGDKIRLKHGEQVTFPELPKGLTYTVVESDYSADGYTTNWPERTSTDTIVEGVEHEALFVNTRMLFGGLLIGQTVEGRGADKDKAFEFSVTFGGADANEEYAYTKSDGTTGKIKSGDTIALKHGETAAIAETEILTGTTYTVTQTDYSSEGYTNNPVSRTHSGTIAEKQIAEARFVNAKYLPGQLLIGQTVTGNGGQPDKPFEFTVTFSGAGASEEYAYTKSDGTTGTIKFGGKITLKHGETVAINGIPKDTTYTVTETDYSADGYTTDPASLKHTGTILEGGTHEALFVNKRTVYGSLTIGQKVAGNGGQPDKAFEFTVTFDGEGKDGSYAYVGTGVPSGSLKSGDKIRLKHGEQITFPELPKGLTYTVVESDYSADGYTTNWPERTSADTIIEDGKHEALFVNTRLLFGGLLIGQTVEGSGADKGKAFEYTVTFGGTDANEEYAYTKSDGTTGRIKSGGKLTLKHGESAAIAETEILTGTVYTVTQTDYSAEGYTTNPAGLTHSGTIVEKQIAEARFVNAKYLPGKLTLTADPKVVPGDGKTPSQLTATLTDYEGNPVANREVVFTLPDQSEVKATTDESGKAVIPYTPPKLNATTPEDHNIMAKVDSLTEGKLTATTTVTAMPAAIIGVLRDNTTGEIIPNATIVITNDSNGEKHTITTDANGAYFHPVAYGGEYTISFTKKININGVDESITFTQKAEVDSHAKGGERVPAHITAVGIVLLKQPDGKSSLLNSALADKMRIYLQDANGHYIVDQNGAPKAFGLQSNGTFYADGLTAENYNMEVRYEVAPGKELTIIRNAKLDVKANGELNISQELVDPYGIITDANTDAKIEGATVTLYYADTPRNRANGIVPGTKVTLPEIPGFAPNDNASPSQDSDATGSYAYMVFPDTDYYVMVTKTGYKTHLSKTISVGSDIVRYDVQLVPLSSGGNSGGTGPDPEPGNPESGNGGDEPGNGGNEPGNGGNEPGNGGNEPDDGGNEPGNGGNEPDDGGNEPGNGGNEPDNSGNEPVNSGNETGSGNNGAGNSNNELDNVPKTGDNSLSPIFYLALALLSLIAIGFCLLGSKKKKHIQ